MGNFNEKPSCALHVLQLPLTSLGDRTPSAGDSGGGGGGGAAVLEEGGEGVAQALLGRGARSREGCWEAWRGEEGWLDLPPALPGLNLGSGLKPHRPLISGVMCNRLCDLRAPGAGPQPPPPQSVYQQLEPGRHSPPLGLDESNPIPHY